MFGFPTIFFICAGHVISFGLFLVFVLDMVFVCLEMIVICCLDVFGVQLIFVLLYVDIFVHALLCDGLCGRTWR